MKMHKFWLKCHWILFLRVQLKYFSIGSDNCLVPIRRQAIIWYNDGLGFWRIYASLGFNECFSLIKPPLQLYISLLPIDVITFSRPSPEVCLVCLCK